MMNSYRTEHPNAAHQLMVAPSKHYYLGREGLLKYQKKPFAVTLADVPGATRQHMVTYTLRDHCSTLLYAEVCFAPWLMSLRAFLARAWGSKPRTPFRGVPEVLVASSKVLELFAADVAAVSELGVRISPATSGFQSGIHGALAVEKWLAGSIDRPVDEGLAWLSRLCELDGKDKMRRTTFTKLEMWERGVGQVRELPPQWASQTAVAQRP